MRGEEKLVVLSVEMLLHRGAAETLEEQAAQYTQRRWERQPPSPAPAASSSAHQNTRPDILIEQCGLKGLRLGQAQISERHANVIINLGGATAQDVRRLIDIASLMVRDRFGLALEPEIEVVGEWPEAAIDSAIVEAGIGAVLGQEAARGDYFWRAFR